MSYLKRRIIVFLCMVMAFTMVFCVVPQEQVQAATKPVFAWTFGSSSSVSKEAEIELGVSDLYIGDYVSACDYSWYMPSYSLSLQSGVSYKSSDTNIISVDKNGKIDAKKLGTATITIKFNGTTGKCKLTVVESVKSIDPKYEEGKKICEKLVSVYSTYGNKITNKNRYKVLQAYKEYLNGTVPSSYDFLVAYGGSTTYINCPIAQRAKVVSSKISSALYNYGNARNPLATMQGKQFKVKSITGAGTKITINLKSKVTEEQIVGIQFTNYANEKVTAKKASTLKFKIYVYKKNGKYIGSTATVKKGSNKITIKTSKLTKGKTYYLSGNWLGKGSGNPNSFKAK